MGDMGKKKKGQNAAAPQKMESELINPNPTVYAVKEVLHQRPYVETDDDEEMSEEIDALEIFDLIRRINDPEHPLTLEQLNVTQHDLIQVDNSNSQINISFTPTIPHCSMATLIGLCIRVKLLRSLPSRFKVDIRVAPGSHASEDAVNKQLNDKERVAAALENAHLVDVVNTCTNTNTSSQASCR